MFSLRQLCNPLVFSLLLPVLLCNAAWAGNEGAGPAIPFDEVVPLSDQAWRTVIDCLLRIEQDTTPGFPHATERSSWQTTNNGGWTGGFYPGLLWLVAKEAEQRMSSQAVALRYKATHWSQRLVARQFETTNHDLGFLFLPTWVEAFNQTGKTSWRKGALTAAASLAKRFTPGGFIQSWGPIGQGQYAGTVIIDNMMNLELLYWAAKESGIVKYAQMADSHARLTQRSHIRPDGGTYHLVDFDRNTGEKLRGRTHQGLNTESTWSRGQAWGIAGFAIAFQYSKDPSFLGTAESMADYFLTHLPADGVAPWDFQAGPTAAKDTSANAIAAYGLLLVAESLQEQGDLPAATERVAQARRLLQNLHPYSIFADPESSQERGLLLGGTLHYSAGISVEQTVIFGDYYYLRSLLKLAEWERT